MYINKVTNEYPMSEAQIIRENPNTSFMQQFIAPEQYAWVFPTPQPTYDVEMQGIREGEPNLTTFGYAQVWVTYPRYVEYTDVAGVVHTVAEQVAVAAAATLLAKRQAMVCTPWKMRSAMTLLGIRMEVEAAVAASTQDTKDAYAYAQDFKRLDPLVITLGLALGKTDLFLDELFGKAMSL